MPRGCALLGGFAIGARVALLWRQREREMSASACTRSVPGFTLLRCPLSIAYRFAQRSERCHIFLGRFRRLALQEVMETYKYHRMMRCAVSLHSLITRYR